MGAAYVDGVIVAGDVAISDGEIEAVGLGGVAGGDLAIPGLVDAQVNGYAGVDILSSDAAALDDLGAALLRDGVARYQPTLITASEDDLLRALGGLASYDGERGRGHDRVHRAMMIGIHLEGPFLSAERAGAHPIEHLRSPDPDLLTRLLDAGPVRTVTLAPELPGADELIAICVRRGVVVSLGHSACSAADGARAFRAGAGAVTHLFNAMAPITARAPGLAAAALATDGIAIQLIADGVHVSDELIKIAFAAAPARCSLVSDAIAAAGRPDGPHRLGTVPVEVCDGIARRNDGTLAGSTARLADGLLRLHRIGIDRADAVASVTHRPARLLAGGAVGTLRPGAPADLLIVDEELRLQRVIVAGRELEAADREGGARDGAIRDGAGR